MSRGPKRSQNAAHISGNRQSRPFLFLFSPSSLSPIRPLFWFSTVAFNLAGITDLIVDYANAVRLDLPAVAGQLGATWVIPILYVPLLMITHIVALCWLLRPQPAPRALTTSAVVS